MAKIILVCPFCQTKLETPDANVGRDGQCPACEKIFEITPREGARGGTAAGAGRLAGAREYEYQENNALVATVAVGVCLILLILSTFLRWGSQYGKLVEYLPGIRITFLAVSLACLSFFIFSAVGGKSLMPAVIVSGAWGTVAVLWSWGIWYSVHKIISGTDVAAVQESLKSELAIKGGVLLPLVAGLLLTASSAFVVVITKESSTFQRLGFFTAIAQLLAVILGIVVIAAHVRPAIAQRAGTVQAAESGRPARARPERQQPPPNEEPAAVRERPERASQPAEPTPEPEPEPAKPDEAQPGIGFGLTPDEGPRGRE